MLNIPKNGAEIQEVDGVKYLVARVEEEKTCSYYLNELRAGRPVVVPYKKRGHLTGLLKQAGVFTNQKTVVPGLWITFIPCAPREFKP